ncbi:MAG: phospholipase D family protein [Flavobacteriales bacterium]|nr:phospholipase D family protein [Flavobacteriales bacterium]
MERHQLKLANSLPNDLRGCDELWVAVALASDAGFQLVQRHIDPSAKQHWVVGVDLATSPNVLRTFMEEDGNRIAGRYNYKQGRTFHPKVYVIRTGEKYVGYVGSGNCTNGGFENNVEIALRTEELELCNKLVATIETWHKHGKAVDEEFLEAYEQLVRARNKRRQEEREETESLLVEEGAGGIDLNRIDFTGQYFKREHFEAFTGRKPWMETPAVNAERVAVRNQLYRLNDLLLPQIKRKGWDLHDHYVPDDIVSSAVHGQYTSNRLDGIWLHYGRGKAVLKRYGADSTPLDFMRLQVIVHGTNVGIWLRVSKDNGSPYDRQHIKDKLTNDPQYVSRLFTLVQALPEHYFIGLNNTYKDIREFNTETALRDHLLTADNKYYFIIGMEMQPGDPRLSDSSIVNTVMNEFEGVYPIYDMMLHRLPK